MVESWQYRNSKATPLKQQSFEAALRVHISICQAIIRKYDYKTPYLYIDLNAGPGEIDGEEGSPVIFLRVAREKGIVYRAEFFEMDPVQSERLCGAVQGDPLVTVHPVDHHILLSQKLDVRAHYGVIYADPSNARLPFQLLRHLNQSYRKVDVMINLACASYKRSVEFPDYVPLDLELPAIKDHWLVREPVGNFQWSILIGTNWRGYPDYLSHGFHRIQDRVGRAIYERLVYTRRQRSEIPKQLSLLEDV